MGRAARALPQAASRANTVRNSNGHSRTGGGGALCVSAHSTSCADWRRSACALVSGLSSPRPPRLAPSSPLQLDHTSPDTASSPARPVAASQLPLPLPPPTAGGAAYVRLQPANATRSWGRGEGEGEPRPPGTRCGSRGAWLWEGGGRQSCWLAGGGETRRDRQWWWWWWLLAGERREEGGGSAPGCGNGGRRSQVPSCVHHTRARRDMLGSPSLAGATIVHHAPSLLPPAAKWVGQ